MFTANRTIGVINPRTGDTYTVLASSPDRLELEVVALTWKLDRERGRVQEQGGWVRPTGVEEWIWQTCSYRSGRSQLCHKRKVAPGLPSPGSRWQQAVDAVRRQRRVPSNVALLCAFSKPLTPPPAPAPAPIPAAPKVGDTVPVPVITVPASRVIDRPAVVLAA